MRTCHNCGRHYITGRKALVLGAMHGVCLDCASKAIRVCVSTTNAKCVTPSCNGHASVCRDCQEKHLAARLMHPFAPAIAALKAMVRGLGKVMQPDASTDDYITGKLEGLESALALLEEAVR